MVDDILNKVRAMLDTTDRKEIKAALSHFIERITIDGQDVTIEYSFKKPATANVPTAGDPGGLRGVMQYLNAGFYPVQAPHRLFMNRRGKLKPSTWSEVVEQHKVKSLRSLAKEYGVSHEAVRRVLRWANETDR
jgi:hypothetical protein